MPIFGNYDGAGENDDFLPNTTIRSSEVDANFEAIKVHLNSQFVDDAVIGAGAIDGSKIADGSIVGSDKIAPGTITAAEVNFATAPGVLLPNSVSDVEIVDGSVGELELGTDAVTTIKIANNNVTLDKLAVAVQRALTPVGAVQAFGLSTLPTGWTLMDGTAVDIVTYQDLWDAMGNLHLFGPDPGGGQFLLPDAQGRMVVGSGTNFPFASNEGAVEALRDLDHAHDVDPAAQTSSTQSSIETGALVGFQASDVPAILAGASPPISPQGARTTTDFAAAPHTHNININSTGSSTTDLPHLALNWAIYTGV